MFVNLLSNQTYLPPQDFVDTNKVSAGAAEKEDGKVPEVSSIISPYFLLRVAI